MKFLLIILLLSFCLCDLEYINSKRKNLDLDSPYVSQTDAKLYSLYHMLDNTNDENKKQKIIEEIEEEWKFRDLMDNRLLEITKLITTNENEVNNILTNENGLSDDHNCYFKSIEIYEDNCGKLHEYGLSRTNVLINLCEKTNGEIVKIRQAIEQVCKNN